MDTQIATQYRGRGNGSSYSPQPADTPGVWHQVWTAPFRAIRAIYWMLDRDAKIRSQGVQTVGRVANTRTESQVYRDSETGTEETIYTHYVSYEFVAGGRTHTREKKVGSLAGLSAGSTIRVYFLPDTATSDSAIDWDPRVLDERQQKSLEAGNYSRR